MRRIDKAKESKGSAFVEFINLETVNRFLNADPVPAWEGKELLIMTKWVFSFFQIEAIEQLMTRVEQAM